MSKGKKIEARPKRRRPSKQNDVNQTTPAQPEPAKRVMNTFAADKMRPRKLRHRSHHDWASLFGERFLSCELQKRGVWLSFAAAAFFVLIAGITYQFNVWRRAELVRTALALPKLTALDISGERSQGLFWGTYRPGLYFGMRHRSPNSLLFGISWVVQDLERLRFRHSCDSSDDIRSYNWIEHDGRQFGVEEIDDVFHRIKFTFIKRPSSMLKEDWTVRISAVSKNETGLPKPIAFIPYFYYPTVDSVQLIPKYVHEKVTGLQGRTSELGDFRINFHPTIHAIQQSAVTLHIPREDAILPTLFQHVGIQRGAQLVTLVEHGSSAAASVKDNHVANSLFYELTVLPKTIQSPADEQDVVLEIQFTNLDSSKAPLVGAEFTSHVSRLSQSFHDRFEERFDLDQTKYSEKQVRLAKMALSNLLGGIGYFYGSSLVRSPDSGPDPVSYWPAPLFTATPSRPQFPRGFLWDEGFHCLLLVNWDPMLALESLSHWLDLLNTEGWIPREQILGWEARARVPDEFVVQRNSVANPPALILAVEALLDKLPKLSSYESGQFRRWAITALPRLHSWYQWFNRTQAGPIALSYRWRGRKVDDPHQLNPLTLSSGLDDYPRASHPTTDERHLDLRCWMALFARVMARLASLVGQYLQADASDAGQKEQARSLAAQYSRWADLLADPVHLDELHWSPSASRYADWGLHTDSVMLVAPTLTAAPAPGPNGQPPAAPKKVRQVGDAPKLQFVTSSIGYLTIFPLLLRLLPPDSPRLSSLMDDLANEDLLWSPHGLRSLARTSPMYHRANTEDDPPYWRGAIWINMNYLAVRALKFYAHHTKTPHLVAIKSADLATRLTANLVESVLGEFSRTGYLWEQYNDMNGRGQRAHPFAGWTALITTIMAEGG